MKHVFKIWLLALIVLFTYKNEVANAVQINGELEGAMFEQLAADPANTEARFYYNTSTNLPKFYNGSSWENFASFGGFAAGSAGAPSINFSGDSDTGFYNLSSGETTYSSNGTAVITFESQGIRTISGSAALPSYTFGGDENTGIYKVSTDQIGFTTAGTVAFRLGTAAAVFEGTDGFYLANDGSASLPAMKWLGDTNTGILRAGDTGTGAYIEVSVNGTARARFFTTAVTLQKGASGVGSTTACWSSTNSGIHGIGECSSSQRYKENIVDMPDVDSAKVYDLRAVKYRWKSGHGNAGEDDYGFIAEEVYDELPLLVDTNGTDKEGVNYRHMVALLQNELKKLRARVVALEAHHP